MITAEGIVGIDDWTIPLCNYEGNGTRFEIRTRESKASLVTWAWLTEARTIQKPVCDLDMNKECRVSVLLGASTLVFSGWIESKAIFYEPCGSSVNVIQGQVVLHVK